MGNFNPRVNLLIYSSLPLDSFTFFRCSILTCTIRHCPEGDVLKGCCHFCVPSRFTHYRVKIRAKDRLGLVLQLQLRMILILGWGHQEMAYPFRIDQFCVLEYSHISE